MEGDKSAVFILHKTHGRQNKYQDVYCQARNL